MSDDSLSDFDVSEPGSDESLEVDSDLSDKRSQNKRKSETLVPKSNKKSSSINQSNDKIKGSFPVKTLEKNQPKSVLQSNRTISEVVNTNSVPIHEKDEREAENADITKGPAVTTEASAKKLILQYMSQQNRPYSVIQVHDNLHGRVPKPTVQRVMDNLCAPQQQGYNLKMKEYGKAKIYYLNQESLSADYSPHQLATLDSEIQSMKETCSRLQQRELELKHQLEKLEEDPDDVTLLQVISELQQRVTQKEIKLRQITNIDDDKDPKKASILKDPNAMRKAVEAFNAYRKVWKERKGKCMEVANMIADSMGRSAKELMVEMGLETDEDEGLLSIPEAITMVEPK